MPSWDYEHIKALAKETRRRIVDLLALAPANDPFYCGTPADRTNAQWFADLWDNAGYDRGVHLRRAHYWAVSQNPPLLMPSGEVYTNTEKCWDYLVQASKIARYMGLVDISAIIDKKNPAPHTNRIYGQTSPEVSVHTPNLSDPTIWIDGMDDSVVQPYHVEVWCEKSTMDDVILPIVRRYGANLVTFEGEVSISAVRDLVFRIRASGNRPTRIFYISDFDPAGNSMPVAMSRKLEYLLDHYGCIAEVMVTPIALTAQQIRKYKLPRIPIKETERRAERFENAFGAGACELDALEALFPGELGKLIEAHIKRYYSIKARDLALAAKERLRLAVTEKIAEITGKYTEHIEAVNEMLREISQISIDLEPYKLKPQEVNPYTDDHLHWLFSSNRDYEEQIASYKAHKGA